MGSFLSLGARKLGLGCALEPERYIADAVNVATHAKTIARCMWSREVIAHVSVAG